MDPVASFTLETFLPRIGELFRLPDDELDLELVAATAGPAGGRPGGGFRLLFRGPVAPPLEQGTRLLSHPGHGSFALFLVPVAGDAVHREYEAVFA